MSTITREEAVDTVQEYLHDCAATLGFPINRETRPGLHQLMVDAAQQGVSLDDFREFVLEDYSPTPLTSDPWTAKLDMWA